MAATKTMASRLARTMVTSGASGPMPHHLLELVCDGPTPGRDGDGAVSSQRELDVDVRAFSVATTPPAWQPSTNTR